MTTVASGRCTSEPAEVAIAIGTNPSEATSPVRNTGRSRCRGAQSEDSVGSHSLFISFTKFVEMVHHQDTVQYSHTEQGDETDSCRDAERESAQPEGYDTSDK